MRRLFVIIIVVAILLTLVAVGLIAWSRWKTASNENVNNENVNVPLDANTITAEVPTVDANERNNAVASGRSFAEQYASWAPETVAATIGGLQERATTSFVQNLLSSHESQDAPDALRSVVSRVLSSSVKDWADDGSRAEIEFVLSRTEDRENSDTVEYYETLTLTLVNQNDQWLIDSASWSPSRIQPTSNGG